MNCEELKSWLVVADQSRISHLPAAAGEHLDQCPECRNFISRLSRKLEDPQERLSDAEVNSMGRNILASIQHSSPIPRFEGFPFAWWKPALAVTILLLISVFLTFHSERNGLSTNKNPLVPGSSEAIFWSNGGSLTLPDGTEKPMGTGENKIPGGTKITLLPQASATAILLSCGNILFSGSAVLILFEDGFKPLDGSFQASFRRSGKPFRVFLPQVTLGIRGTVLQFDLHQGTGVVKLIEGRVDVHFDNGADVLWNGGEQLHFRNGFLDMPTNGTGKGSPRGELRRNQGDPELSPQKKD